MEIEKHNLMRTAMLLLLMMLTATTAWADHKIVVIADPHVMSNDLLVGNQNNEDGSAWQTYLAGSRKLIDYSKTLFDQTVATISGMTEKPELVLIVGDLTKDGEKLSHDYVKGKLDALKDAGIPTLVIPGNHDLGTSEAKIYNGDETYGATTIAGADAFATQYADYGYGLTSTERESTTLTYACEPISGLVVIGIDSGTDGVLYETTLDWVCTKAADARTAGKQVIAMMHHPLIPHITGGNMFVETVSVSNYANVRNRLASAGITTIFTGHFHTSDIAKDWNDDKTKTIYDVTTGSLCSYPCDYRVVTLNNAMTAMSIGTSTATGDATITAAAAKTRLTTSMTNIIKDNLLAQNQNIDEETAAATATQLANAYVYHAEGNENLSSGATSCLSTLQSALSLAKLLSKINDSQYTALNAMVTSMLQDKSNYGDADRVNQTNDRNLIFSTTPGLTIDGDGTSSAPYEISSYANLKDFAAIVNGTGDYSGFAYPNACAILMDDIVCKNGLFDSDYATDWTPIGNYDDKYTGTFDGDGYTITGLSTPTSNSSDYVGLFGYVGSGGVVQNVKLEVANITGATYVGGIVGNNSGTVQNIVVDNSNISGSSSSVGSMAGCNHGIIQNCAFIGTSIVRGSNDYTGGIAGYVSSGTIQNCYVAISGSGSISATGNNVGGIVGYLDGGGIVENCHYSGFGAINANDNIGGIVGYNYKGKVRCCYYAGTGEITATAISNFIGAIIGKNNGTTEYCYYNKNNTDVTNAIGIAFDTEKVKGLTAAQFKDENFLTTYNFSDQIWLQGVVAPLLKGMPYTVSFKANGGTGSMDDQTVTSENDDVLRSNSFTRDNYHFTGWNTKADGKGVAVATDVQAKLVGPETLYAQWHTLTAHYASEATCTTAGNTAYWSCSVCGKYFSDEEGETEIEENSWVIAATGHNVVNSVCTRCNGVTTLYIDADGTEKNEVAVPLTGSETNLSAGWYVAQGTINYDHKINFDGTAHLILADGCKMTVEPNNAETVNAIQVSNLTIYAQSNGSAAGSLTAIINYSNDIATAGTSAIVSMNTLTINGGNITARSTNTGNITTSGHGGIAAMNYLNINGGNIVATSESTEKGCGMSGKITINWNNDNSSLYFYPYRNDGFGGYIKVADGKTISDGTNTYSGTLSEAEKAAIVRKLLTPPTRTLTANSDGNGNYWATYYNGSTSYTTDANTTKIYKGAVNGNSVQLTQVADIPAGNAVILKSTESTITLTRTTKSADFTGNGLKGTDIDMVPPANTYCLTNGGNGVGFYQFSATYGNIPANRAYLIIAGGGGNGAPAYNFLGFDEEDATSLSEELRVKSEESIVYDLQGRKVDKPTHGLYIVNGKKVLIK